MRLHKKLAACLLLAAVGFGSGASLAHAEDNAGCCIDYCSIVAPGPWFDHCMQTCPSLPLCQT
ncbi:hypothetical protein V8J88_10340 [Massilia sp. W12]|uniref:hypothetical protein n=1 Tax=Massilia sp. W12 TaxID=3126507 RepID=UPI0030CD80DA